MSIPPRPDCAPGPEQAPSPTLACLLALLPRIYDWLLHKKGFSDEAATAGFMAGLTAGLTALVTGQARELRNRRAWLLKIAFKNAARTSGSERSWLPLEAAEAAMAQEPDEEDAAERDGMARDIRGAVSALPEPQRLAVTYTHFDGLSIRRAAKAMSVPDSTFRRHLEGGMRRLEEILSLPPSQAEKFRGAPAPL